MHPTTGLIARMPFRPVWTRALLMLLLAVSFILPVQAQNNFLQPEQAFQVTAKADGPEAVQVSWKIADGYYLYRDKLRFATETAGITIGTPDLPEAEIKQDQFFGEMAVYHHAAEIRLPLTREPGSDRTLMLDVTAQGCADAGLCYPPQRQTLKVKLPKAIAAPPPAKPAATDLPAPLSATRFAQSLGLDGTDDLPPVEAAFRFQAEVASPEQIQLTWDIAPGTYLYRDLIAVTLENADGMSLGDIVWPTGVVKPDSVLPDGQIGEVEIYENRLDLTLPLRRSSSAPAIVNLIVKYQGCAEIGVCYPPQTQRLTLNLPESSVPAAQTTAGTLTTAPVTSSPAIAEPIVSEQDQIAAVLAGGSLWLIVAVFFGMGLLLAFTPCVFPMIPILSGIIAGHGATMTTRKAFMLSLVYVLAMALTYTVVGVLAGLFGANLQAVFQDPWILSAFALVFVLLALSMFGFYDLQLPSSLQSRLAALSNRQQGGTLLGVAIMGLLSALIVGPCIAPPLFGALIYISQTGDAVLGGVALFALSLGMGAPLLVLGASAGRLLPRAGVWMDTIKAVFGVALLGVAILLLERILPAAIAMLLWGLLLICSAVYMGALSHLPTDSSGWSKLWKGVGFVLLIYGALMLLGAAAGGKDTLQPLRGLAFGGPVEHASFQRVKTVADLDRALSAARAAGQPAMLDFYADWCVSCKEMERYTFSDPSVIAEMRRFVLLQADVTANDDADQALMQGRFGIPGPPALLFFAPSGDELKGSRLVGFTPADSFAGHLRRIASTAWSAR